MLTARFLLRLRSYHYHSMGGDLTDITTMAFAPQVETIGHLWQSRTFMSEFEMGTLVSLEHQLEEGGQGVHATHGVQRDGDTSSEESNASQMILDLGCYPACSKML